MIILKPFLAACIYLLFITSTHAGSELQDMSGNQISLSDLRGKWVLINYWASWCRTCVDEIPELNRFYEENKNIALFAVNYDAIPFDTQQKLIKQLDIRYPSLIKDPANVLQLGDIRGVPVTFVFNPKEN